MSFGSIDLGMILSLVGKYFPYLYLAVILLVSLPFFFIFAFRKWQYGVTRVVTALLAVLVSVGLGMLTGWIGGILAENGLRLLGNNVPAVAELLDSLDSGSDALRAVCSMILAPIAYMFFVIWLIPVFRALVKPLTHLFFGKKAVEKKDPDKKWFKREGFGVAGAFLGMAFAVVLVLALMVPWFGTVETVDSITSVAVSTSTEETAVTEIGETLHAVVSHPVSNVVATCGPRPIYGLLTTVSVNGEVTNMRKEMSVIGGLGSVLLTATEENADGQAIADSLRVTADEFSEIVIVPTLIADVSSSAYEKWTNGETFCGIAAPLAGSEYQDLLFSFLEGFGNGDRKTVTEDFGTLMEICAVSAENGVIGKVMAGEAAGLFEDKDLTSSVLTVLFENKRLTKIVGVFTETGLRAVAEQLNVTDDYAPVYEEFENALVAAVTARAGKTFSADEWTAFSAEIDAVYGNHGLYLTPGLADAIALDLMNRSGSLPTDFGGIVSYLTSNEAVAVSAFANIRSENVEEIASELNLALPADFLSLPFEERSTVTGTLAAKASVAKSAGIFRGKDILSVDTLEKFAETTVLVLKNELTADGTAITDAEKEADLVADIVANLITAAKAMTEDSENFTEPFLAFGNTLDRFRESQLIGENSTAAMLRTIWQSDAVCEQFGLTKATATTVAEEMRISGGLYSTQFLDYLNAH